MKQNALLGAEKYAKARQRKKRWYRAVTALACVVVFCTVYALILPAITMEKGACEIPEHTHSEACYTQITSVTRTKPVCTIESLKLHRHDVTCYDSEGNLTCGYADFVVHQHDSACYDESGNLWCPLPEIETHAHTESCYAVPETGTPEVHTHTDDCYTVERGELICTESTEPAHVHTDDCYTETSALVCEEEHAHTEGCYEAARELTCGDTEEPAHQHTDQCYEQSKTLICDLPTEPAEEAEPAETELICDKTEVILHEHTSDCFDGDGNLICGKIQVLEHQHTDACFTTVEEPADTETLTCTLPEDETHTHGPRCYGTWELTCGLEEHTHSEACQPAELTEEEQAQVEEVITLIDALPASEEIEETAAAFEEAEDEDGLEAYLSEIYPQVSAAYEAYSALTDAQKAYVQNAGKLTALEQLLDGHTALQIPSLTDDGAFVRELRAEDVEVLPDSEQMEDLSSEVLLSVRIGETAAFSFRVDVGSYSDTCYQDGRVKLEFVLPWTEEQAVFDLPSMTWLDGTEGYAPVVTTETRIIDGTERACQVLTGYRQLLPPRAGDGAIPGEFTGTVYVTVVNMQHGDVINVQISAAMEYGTWDGICTVHGIQEKLTVATDTVTVNAQLSEEERQAIYDGFVAELEVLEAAGELDEKQLAAAEDIRQRLEETYKQGGLSDEQYTELYERLTTLLLGDVNSIAEAAVGTNWILLRDSGWFEAYSNCDRVQSYVMDAGYRMARTLVDGATYAVPPSDVQVSDRGGAETSDDGSVSVSKTISGTELENVFDITLQVQTSQNISEISEEPDMAVVIVMDISNTMNSNFGGVTRYAAAMTAAEDFLDQFAANNSLGISKVGYVAFNTDAHKIFGLQSCSTQEQANALKNTMRTQTGSIINAYGYNESHSRFTNVEAGLALASDMLNGASNKNKYIIFLSDGFPTTYISSGYSGYDPYDSTGTRFYDSVLNKPCLYGTSYSNEAAYRARQKAVEIKASGTTIFSIGVDVSGQTIQKYITQSENADGFSVVDRKGTTYEIGDASSTESYRNWLRERIGSGYYYDSADSAGLSAAYSQIFAEIKHQIAEGSEADWVASDPLPTISGTAENVEFIGFYNNSPALVSGDLTGSHTAGGENTAAFNTSASAISWDLKKSGYQTSTNGGTTTYTYQLVYRVRLKNEGTGFTEGTVYPTNDTTTLQYRNIQGTDGNQTVSDPKTVNFPIPSVQGYLSELTFTKVDLNGNPLPGAEFTLNHDSEHCSICRGDGTSVTIADMTAISDDSGTVSFAKVPSGHQYTLTETGIPLGYSANGDTYTVEVAYDTITVTVTAQDGTEKVWDSKVVNRNYYELPSTGGAGTVPYTMGGVLLLTGAALLLLHHHTRRRKEDPASS